MSTPVMFITRLIPTLTAGIAIGLLGCSAMQKWLINPMAYNQCNQPTKVDTHTLVTISSVVGDTKYCLHNAYVSK